MNLEQIKITKKASLIAICSSGGLSLIKLILFFFTGSLVIGLSAWDSISDLMVSFITKKTVQFARSSEVDEHHPYGRGKAENIAALGQGMLILGGAASILFMSVKEVYKIYPNFKAMEENISFSLSIWKILFFIIASFISYKTSKWIKICGKKSNSPALIADAEHYKMDFIVNLFTALSLAVVFVFGYKIIDPLIAFLFSFYIIFSAFGLIKESIYELMDRDIPSSIKQEAIQTILDVDTKIIDVHNLKGRKSGHRYFFEYHITLPDDLTFLQVHDIIEKTEKKLKEKFEGTSSAHADPASVRHTHHEDDHSVSTIFL